MSLPLTSFPLSTLIKPNCYLFLIISDQYRSLGISQCLISPLKSYIIITIIIIIIYLNDSLEPRREFSQVVTGIPLNTSYLSCLLTIYCLLLLSSFKCCFSRTVFYECTLKCQRQECSAVRKLNGVSVVPRGGSSWPSSTFLTLCVSSQEASAAAPATLLCCMLCPQLWPFSSSSSSSSDLWWFVEWVDLTWLIMMCSDTTQEYEGEK